MRTLFYLFAFVQSAFIYPQVGIGTATPNPSSVLDISSSSRGILIPRLNQSQRNAIRTPANGLLVYQTDNTNGFYYYNGNSWTPMNGGQRTFGELRKANEQRIDTDGVTKINLQGSGPSSNVILNTRDSYLEVTTPGTYRISYTITPEQPNYGAQHQVYFFVTKNGTNTQNIINESRTRIELRALDNDARVRSVSKSFITTLNSNDRLYLIIYSAGAYIKYFVPFENMLNIEKID